MSDIRTVIYPPKVISEDLPPEKRLEITKDRILTLSFQTTERVFDLLKGEFIEAGFDLSKPILTYELMVTNSIVFTQREE